MAFYPDDGNGDRRSMFAGQRGSASGLDMFRSTDAGVSWEPIVFSPYFDDDGTVFGMAGDALYRLHDGGDTWTTIPIPVQTHGDDSTIPLLEIPQAGAGDAEVSAVPTGIVTTKRLAAAMGVAVVMGSGVVVVRRRRRHADAPTR